MALSDQLARVAPHVERLLEDDSVQAQLDRAIANLRAGGKRAQRQGARGAATDRRTWTQLGTAAVAAYQVAQAVRAPEPPARHPMRRLIVLGAVGGGAVLVYRQLMEDTPDPAEG